ncbi:MAG: hypothetical protein IT285_08635 [Bdellovibrionales bacterium]|nr:hypothetical protein [Bdellovibrionales bacterium]
MSGGAILYPQVTSVGPASGRAAPDRTRQETIVPGEFDQMLDRQITGTAEAGARDLGSLKAPLRFSAHAAQRLQSRSIDLPPELMARVTEAVDKCDAKGVYDTLVLAGNTALIVNVKNRTVVTAMDREQLKGNVFTNIDGAVIV